MVKAMQFLGWIVVPKYCLPMVLRRKRFSLKALFAVFLFVFSWCAVNHKAHAFQAYPKTELTNNVDKIFAEWDKKESPGASVGLFKDGRIIYARGYGMANLEYDIPNTPQTVFRIGSTSKHFTAMCIALLIERGKLSERDDIRRYLPEIPDYGQPITIDDMLHHTSGLRNYEALMELAGRDGETYQVPFYTDQEAIDMIARQKRLNFPPGTRYSYSNSNFFLLAEIVGRVSGIKTSEFAKKYVFDPLKMQSTHFHDDITVIVKNRASGYSPRPEGGFRINMTQLEQIGTGSIYTTIEDFFKWDQNFYQNQLGTGSPKLIEMMEAPGKLNNGESVGYGFGLDVASFFGVRQIGHGGSFVGFRSYYMRFPDQRFSVIVLANQGPFPAGEIARKIAILYLKEQFTEPLDKKYSSYRDRFQEEQPKPREAQLSEIELEKYGGTYFSEELDADYRLIVEADSLRVRVGQYYTALIEPVDADRFRWGDRSLVFTRDSANALTGFRLHADPIRDIEFEKRR